MATLAMTNTNDEDELKNGGDIAIDKPDNESEDSDHPDEDYKVLTTSTGRGCGRAGHGRGCGRGRTRQATTDVTRFFLSKFGQIYFKVMVVCQ